MGDVAGLFDPDRVAVVGASEEEGSIGRALIENLSTFEGEVLPINPNRETVFGTTCYPDVESVPGDIDVAIVAVPPSVVVEAVDDLGAAGVDKVVVITAGFSETGAEGARRERALADVATEHGMTLVGPNSLGILSSRSSLNATFGPIDAVPGNVSFLSQSGAFITAVMDWAQTENVGFRDIVSLGNKAVLDESDFLASWGDDAGTDVVIGYLEGIEDGRGFVETARRITDETPVIVVKAGRTTSGARAASSHTGAIAGNDRAYEAGLAAGGVLRATSVQALFDYAQALRGLPHPDGDGVAVVTNAGGPGVMATDAVGTSGFDLASFAEATRTELDEMLPSAATVHNPVDVIGDASVERFRNALDIVLSDPGVAAGVVISAPTALVDATDLAEAIAGVQADHETPVVAALMGGDWVEPAEPVLADAGIPNFFDPARAVDALDATRRHRELVTRATDDPRSFDVDQGRVHEVLSRVRDREENHLGVEAMEILEAYGVPIPRGEIVDGPDEATAAVGTLEGDAVLKLVSPDVVHKSDIGGVRVGVSTADAADVYEDLVARARAYQPDATVLGVQVQERLDVGAGTETIVGVNKDPDFGPLVVFGLGGIFVEVLEDTSVRLAPVGPYTAEEMVTGIDAAPLLQGARGRDPVDVGAVVDVVERISKLAADFPAILELDINPLLATPDGAVAMDFRVTVDPDQL
ncbi:MAG: acetate--CoA ligase family protein [Halobacteriaceae archaeon]